MGINLYDNPAQAKFINTYVPIQFENLYRVADKAQKNLDENEKLMDDTTLNYSSLNTMSDADKAKWDSDIYGPIKNFVDTKFNSDQAMKDPTLQSEYKAMVRRLKNNPTTSALMTSAVNMREVAKKSDPRWGEYEKNKLRAHDTSAQGVFDGSNIQYEGWDKVEEEIFKDLPKDGTHQKALSTGNWEVSGTTDTDLKNVLANTKDYLATHPFINAAVEKDLQDGNIPKSYYSTDSKGNVLVDPSTGQPSVDKFKYAEDKIYALAKAREHLDYKYIGDKIRANRPTYSGAESPQQYSIVQEENNLLGGQVQSNLRTAYLEAIGKQVIRKDGQLQANTRGPLGSIGASYWTANSNASRLEGDVAKAKITLSRTEDPAARANIMNVLAGKEKALSNARESVSRLQGDFDNQIAADVSLHKYPTAIGGRQLKPVLTKDQVAEAYKTKMTPAFISQWYNTSIGTPFQLKNQRGVVANTYTVPGSEKLTFVDRHKKLPLTTTGAHTDKSVHAMNTLMSSGRLSNKISFAPTSTAIKYSDNIENYGSAYIDKGSALQSGLTPYDISTLKKSGMISEQTVEVSPATGTGATAKPAKTVTYLVIPTTYNIPAESTSPGYEAARVDQKNPNFIANPAHYGLNK